MERCGLKIRPFHRLRVRTYVRFVVGKRLWIPTLTIG
jgi:hypothetical protein